MNNSEYTILIPFDFSVPGIQLTKNVIRQTESSNVSIHLLHVAAPGQELPAVSDVVSSLGEFSSPRQFFIEVVSGEPAARILEYAEKISASVMFISNTNNDNRKYDHVGTVASSILEHAVCPVLVIKNELLPESVKTILLPIDINAENKLKISTALFFALFFNHAIIRIVSVVFDIDDYSLNKMVYRLHHITGFFERAGVECTGEIIRCSREENESIGKAVVDYSHKSEAEMVLLMAGSEDSKSPENHISEEDMYMISHIQNNVISITPLLKGNFRQVPLSM